MRKLKKKLWIYGIVAILIGWPLVQMIGMLTHEKPQEKAEKLLYQVSFFQMELLGSYLTESAKATNTGALNALRQAVYSAQFVHQHLTMAYGSNELSKLESLSQLLQYMMRLQIGASRPLKSDEQQLFMDINMQFADIYDAYSKLMSSRGDVVGSQNDRLVKADKAISDLLRKKLLQ
ncbi:S-adenosylmethionine decarboxylase [Paenibacillus allorhizosphaerae]|uniref:S-adenosylmethionine decarboxylase n=1 Tax=Paenibacillus allorhizosphaerae TaxID=2849866 RepID=A0ABN7TN21_9BACL|nr:S-adenosylmethionine decarboxylase [Paenibacillus allorhizosphaerae]CAG7648004.1 hypothetical protein PAECIP111802_04118 [Paenibacillus allorhizosphaerae]